MINNTAAVGSIDKDQKYINPPMLTKLKSTLTKTSRLEKMSPTKRKVAKNTQSSASKIFLYNSRMIALETLASRYLGPNGVNLIEFAKVKEDLVSSSNLSNSSKSLFKPISLSGLEKIVS